MRIATSATGNNAATVQDPGATGYATAVNDGAGLLRTLQLFVELTRALQRPRALEELLQLIADCAATLAGAPRASIRMLDSRGSRLLAVCRAGAPLHQNPEEEFKLGEGLMGWVVAERQPLRTGDADNDHRFIPRPGIDGGAMGSFLGVPIVSGRACLGVISAVNPKVDYFTDEHEQSLLLLAGICAPQVEIARLSRLATVDPLTGTLNRRGLDSSFPEAAVAGDGKLLSVIMVDIDHFKAVNDDFGHAVGDQVLRRIAEILSSLVRSGDAVIRYGGEEFLMVLPGAGYQVAARVAERVRSTVEASEIVVGDVTVSVAISAGVAERLRGESRELLIRRADGALYRAKREGRNRVVMADQRSPS